MSSPISNVTHAPAATPTAAVQPKATAANVQQTPKDTVTISTAAQSALQEAAETRFQTQQEAAKGDGQAKRLLTKEAATQVTQK